LALENQLTQPEVLAAWYRGDRRAKWRAEVASGQSSVTSQMWVDVLKRMCDAAASNPVVRGELGAAWLPLVNDVSARGHARDGEDMDVPMYVAGMRVDVLWMCIAVDVPPHPAFFFLRGQKRTIPFPCPRALFSIVVGLPFPPPPSPGRAGAGSSAAMAEAESVALSTFYFCASEVLQRERAAGVLASLKASLLEFEAVLSGEGTACGIVYPTWQAFNEQWRAAVQGARTVSQVRPLVWVWVWVFV
jgi:hypothetical protein